MIEFFLFMAAVALIGSLAAGISDLKTTEIPDEIPLLMGVIGVFGWLIYALTFGDFNPLFSSLLFGTVFLIFGWILYKTGQWGGGDALLLGAIIYLLPINPLQIGLFNEFPIAFLVNFMIVGLVYTVIYAVAIGIKNKNTKKLLKKDYKENKSIFILDLAFFIIGIISVFYSIQISIMIFMISFLILFWRYGMIVEKKIFMRKIKTSDVKVGDVIVDFKKWDGITENQLKELKKKKKFVTIKEGVRFAPTFFISLIVTFLLGNVLIIFI